MGKFDKNFLLGAATAAHQVEGNNIHSDCWAMEQMKHTSFLEPSLLAVDHYHRYEEDIKILASAGLNTYRFSIEWARIEPEEGRFVEEEVEHYRQVIACCRKHGVEPFVTLHHFSSPAWLIGIGGWESLKTVDYFTRYTKYVIGALGDQLEYVCTINEANMGLQIAAISERYKRQMMAQMAQASNDSGEEDSNVQMGLNLKKMMENQQSLKAENLAVFGVEEVHNFTSMRSREGDLLIMKAHESARAVVKEMAPHIKVGLSLSLHDMQVVEEGGRVFANQEWDQEYDHYLPFIKEDDFLGIQNYSRSLFGPQGHLPYPKESEMTQMNYEYYPEALENVIRKVAEVFKGDLIVTENGVATDQDSRRIAFIEKALSGVANCIEDGIPVKGYCYWSLMDNFEWQKGYGMTFGLIAVDRSTQKRMPKESLAFLGRYMQ